MQTRIILFFIFLTVNANGQTHRIDSMKKALPGLQARAKVDCLNAIGWEYYYYWIHSDSAFLYTNISVKEASSINYKSGHAEALLVQAGVEGRLLGRPVVMEKMTQQAIELLKDENDLKTLSTAYYSLSLANSMLGNYKEGHKAADKSRQLAVDSKSKFCLGWAEEAIGFAYFKSGEYWKSFDHLIQAVEIGKEINDSLLTSLSLVIIARTFNWAGDPQKALIYYKEGLLVAPDFILLWNHYEDIAYAHFQLKQYDSVLYYQKKHSDNINTITSDLAVRKKFFSFFWGFSIDINIALKQYDSVLAQVLPDIKSLRQSKDVVPLMQALLNLGKVYNGKGNYRTSLQYGREVYYWARKIKSKNYLRESTQLLATTFDQLKQGDSAYYYFKEFTVMKDSMELKQFAGRTALYLAASEAENRIRLLKKDKEINDQQLVLKKRELQKQEQWKNLLVGVLFVLILFSILGIRNIVLKRKNDKLLNQQTQAALTQKAMELEMQALRAQMNPHFIFNCLSAIDNLIQTSQSDKATAYLSRFAKLIRSVLDSSKNNEVSFQQDFETIRLYLEMEKFRCNNKFSFDIQADEQLLQGDYKIPPLIIQPFIENAIHHGLLNKQNNNRTLKVSASLEKENIIYSITDNGIGRKQAAIIKERNRPGQQSYGIAITKERINLHNKNGNGNGNDVEITDLENEGVASGTKAIIRINSFEL